MLRWTFCSVVLLPLLAATPDLHAAHHVDGPAVQRDPAADIADLFAWTTSDADRINLVLTIPAAAFSDAVQYAFRIESSEAYGQAGVVTDVICTFNALQRVECWVGDDDYVTGDASSETGLSSDSGLVKVFAGPRDDPFFFNSTGFNAVRTTVRDAAHALTFDGAGCPVLDADTSQSLLAQLATGTNTFVGSILALVLQIDQRLINEGGDIVAVWGSTHRG